MGDSSETQGVDVLSLADQAAIIRHFWDAGDCARFPAEIASVVTNRSMDTLAQMRSNGTGPKFISWGRVVQYTKADLVEWMDRTGVRVANSAEARKALLSVARTA